jgi:Zn-dependent alcohol dehydrogenase
MKAAVLYEINKPLVVDEIDIDDVGPGQVMVKTIASGLCRSDLHRMEGRTPTEVPAVIGHEAAGIVEQVGEGVTYVQPGDHVVTTFVRFCGTCRYCQTGRPFLCAHGRGTAQVLRKDSQRLTGYGGSCFAEHLLVPERGVVKVREDAPLDKLSILGCAVATGVGAVLNTARVEAGSSVAIIGLGGVGLNVVQGAALASAYPIIAIDVLDHKLEMAKQFGATHLVNAGKEDPVEAVRALTDGGADYAFEVVGRPESVTQAFDMVAPGGEAIMLGVSPPGSKASIDIWQLHLTGKVLRGCLYGSIRQRVDIPRYVDLYMAGRLKLDELISRTYPLEDINEAFAALKAGEVARSIIVF